MLDKINFLKENLENNNIKLEDKKLQQFYKFYEMLVETNKVMNLTAITEYEEVVMKHFVDSLAIVRDVDMSQVESVIDIGTGAGFPGLPLKIAFPEIEFTLMDSLNKRIKFIQSVVDELGLEKIELVHSRAEDLAKKAEYREQYDLVVSRAVANLSTLSEYCIPFVKKDGMFVSYKAKDSEEEINSAKGAIKILGGKIEKCDEFQLEGSDLGRMMVVIRKVKETPKPYPRKAGLPSSNPLK